MKKTYITSDTHFGHANILKFEPTARPFKNVDEMNEAMVREWNNVVSPDDTVWHLGDVFFGSESNLDYVKRLNGEKKLLLGNHDNNIPTQRYLDAGFVSTHSIVKVKVAGTKMWLTHAPIHPGEFNHGLTNNIHGHTHSRLVLDKNGHIDERYINVCVEHTQMRPILLEDIMKHQKEVIQKSTRS